MTSPVDQDIKTLVHLGSEAQERVLRAIFEAIHAHESTGDEQALIGMARDVRHTLRMQRSEHYHKLVDAGPHGPAGRARPVPEVLADLRL